MAPSTRQVCRKSAAMSAGICTPNPCMAFSAYTPNSQISTSIASWLMATPHFAVSQRESSR
jgi:hypothetical protein